MHRCRFSVFVVLVGLTLGQRVACSSELSSYPPVLSIEQAVEIALQENPALSAARSKVEIASLLFSRMTVRNLCFMERRWTSGHQPQAFPSRPE